MIDRMSSGEFDERWHGITAQLNFDTLNDELDVRYRKLQLIEGFKSASGTGRIALFGGLALSHGSTFMDTAVWDVIGKGTTMSGLILAITAPIATKTLNWQLNRRQ